MATSPPAVDGCEAVVSHVSEEDKQLGAELDSFNVNAAKAAVSV